MSSRLLSRLTLLWLLLIAASVFITGITWGLPSRAVDRYLFGERTPWTGEQIIALAGTREHDRGRGADVDVDPLVDRSQPVVLNATDAQRAEIVRRYRLYTHQPDEMITLMALASMRPGEGDLDPKLYQYGGLWIYPVGALLKAASLVGAITLTGDLSHYLDHPQEFGRLYVVARLYVVTWALIGVAALFAIARRLTGSQAAGSVAALLFIAMPVVVNMSHEAKPHLPAAALMLLAVIAADRYVRHGSVRRLMLVGLACGAAFGTVLSALPVFVLLPVMVLLRRQTWAGRARHLAVSGGVGAATYVLTNPYVFINLFTNRDVLRSNFGNSLAMYEIARLGEGFLNAARLLAEGTSQPLAVASALLVLACVLRRGSPRLPVPPSADSASTIATVAYAPPFRITAPRFQPEACLLVLLLAPAAMILIQFVLLAAGKPGEYGRFAVFPDTVIAILATTCLWRVVRAPVARTVIAAALAGGTAFCGCGYLAGFIEDASSHPGRIQAAKILEKLREDGAATLVVSAEPAPYVLPPVDLFKWEILLPPRPYDPGKGLLPGDVRVRPVDNLEEERTLLPPGAIPVAGPDRPWWLDQEISWAGKRFQITRQGS